jgi:hypothetical protein
MFHKPNDIRLHIAERSRDIPALLRYRIQPSNHLRYVIGPIGEMAAPALKEGRGTLIGRVVGLGGFGFLRAGRLLKGAQPQWAQRSSGLYGHPGMPAMVSVIAVDLCLKRVASILVAELGAASEGAVRYGGEEFLVVLPEMQLVDAIRIAERIHRSVEKATIPNEGPGLFGVVTASFGVASAFVGELTAAGLIAVADTALYAAKCKGRNQMWPPLAAPSDASNFEQISFRDRA